MKVTITVDNREKELVKIFGAGGNLDVGDIIIKDDKERCVYIERKTLSDFAASIKDGRYREQKERLKAVRDSRGGGGEGMVKVLYLIEKDINARNGMVGGIPYRTLIGAMMKSMFRDGFSVYQSAGINESCKLIERISKHMENGEYSWNSSGSSGSLGSLGSLGSSGSSGGGGGESYLRALKSEKKANMTVEMCYLAQLKQIPGLSTKSVMAIADQYPNMSAIFKGFSKIDSLKMGTGGEILSSLDILNAKKRMMADIKIGADSENSGRRLGNKVSEKIYIYLVGEG